MISQKPSLSNQRGECQNKGTQASKAFAAPAVIPGVVTQGARPSGTTAGGNYWVPQCTYYVHILSALTRCTVRSSRQMVSRSPLSMAKVIVVMKHHDNNMVIVMKANAAGGEKCPQVLRLLGL